MHSFAEPYSTFSYFLFPVFPSFKKHTHIDGGSTWLSQATLGNSSWQDVAINSDGSKAVAVDSTTGILWTYDNGVWTPQYGAGLHDWSAVDMSADGQTILAAEDDGYLYFSKDGGELVAFCWVWI